VGRAVATKSTLQVVSNVLLAADEERLKLAATNLEIAITYWLDATVGESGAITVPARLLTELVNSLPPGKIDLNLNVRTKTLGLRSGSFEANVKGIDAEEFPPIPTISDTPTTTVSAEILREAIGQVVLAAATDDTRPVLAGVLASFEGDKLVLAAADGFRLAVREVALSSPIAERCDVIIPARALHELGRILSDDEEPVAITVTPNRSQILFHMPNVNLVSRLVEGTFPNYRPIIPQRHSCRVVVNTKEFLNATRVAALFARDASNVIKLQASPGEELTPGRMIVVAQAAEVGDTTGGIDATVEGEGMQIAFNVKYLQDVLGVISTSQVGLEVSSPSSPGVVKPVGVDGYTHVIMPMHIAH
jgi:DNA polymerase-3 subunit beta